MVHIARAEGSHCVLSQFALIFPTVCFLMSRKLEANIPSRMAWVLFCVELPGPSSYADKEQHMPTGLALFQALRGMQKAVPQRQRSSNSCIMHIFELPGGGSNLRINFPTTNSHYFRQIGDGNGIWDSLLISHQELTVLHGLDPRGSNARAHRLLQLPMFSQGITAFRINLVRPLDSFKYSWEYSLSC